MQTVDIKKSSRGLLLGPQPSHPFVDLVYGVSLELPVVDRAPVITVLDHLLIVNVSPNLA